MKINKYLEKDQSDHSNNSSEDTSSEFSENSLSESTDENEDENVSRNEETLYDKTQNDKIDHSALELFGQSNSNDGDEEINDLYNLPKKTEK